MRSTHYKIKHVTGAVRLYHHGHVARRAPKIVNRRFLLKPSVIPTITVMGMDFASLFGNAFLVERIFNWPGLSSYGMNAILNKDSNAVVAVVLIIGLAFVGTSIVVDIVAMILDPRMRQARTR